MELCRSHSGGGCSGRELARLLKSLDKGDVCREGWSGLQIDSRTPMPELTQTRVRELFDYEPDTGALIRRVWRGGRAAPRLRAGSVVLKNGRASRHVRVDGADYPVSHIIWLWMTGELPKDQIDHADRNQLNDRWANLREVTNSQNSINATPITDKKTGARGVTRHRSGTYLARIWVRGKLINLGTFDTVAEASAAYQAARVKYFGEFV